MRLAFLLFDIYKYIKGVHEPATDELPLKKGFKDAIKMFDVKIS